VTRARQNIFEASLCISFELNYLLNLSKLRQPLNTPLVERDQRPRAKRLCRCVERAFLPSVFRRVTCNVYRMRDVCEMSFHATSFSCSDNFEFSMSVNDQFGLILKECCRSKSLVCRSHVCVCEACSSKYSVRRYWFHIYFTIPIHFPEFSCFANSSCTEPYGFSFQKDKVSDVGTIQI
jgi:hypothetical protein